MDLASIDSDLEGILSDACHLAVVTVTLCCDILPRGQKEKITLKT